MAVVGNARVWTFLVFILLLQLLELIKRQHVLRKYPLTFLGPCIYWRKKTIESSFAAFMCFRSSSKTTQDRGRGMLFARVQSFMHRKRALRFVWLVNFECGVLYFSPSEQSTCWARPYKSRMQTDATLLDVTFCVRLHTLLHVVKCCWVVAQNFKPVRRLTTCKRTQQLPTMLGQRCWELLWGL